MRFNIRSVGLSPKSDRKLSEKDLVWADLTFVMEQSQSARIASSYRHLALSPIEVLHIVDDYEYLDRELMIMLSKRINSTLKIIYKI